MAKRIITAEGCNEPFTREPAIKIVAVLDADADLASLGTDWCPMSVAIVPGGKTYMLNASHVWVEV